MKGYFESCLTATKNEFNRLWGSKSNVGVAKLSREKTELLNQLYICAKNKEISNEDYNYFKRELSKYDFDNISRLKRESRRVN